VRRGVVHQVPEGTDRGGGDKGTVGIPYSQNIRTRVPTGGYPSTDSSSPKLTRKA
jgi:hypothetical protein